MTMNEEAIAAAAAKLDEATKAIQEAARILQCDGHPDEPPFQRDLDKVLWLIGACHSTRLMVCPPQSARFTEASDNDTLDE